MAQSGTIVMNGIPVPVLTGENFSQWRFQLKCVLEASDLDQYVFGDEPVVTDDKKDVMKRGQAQARGFINGSIDAKYQRMIEDCSTARSMWIRLESEHVDREPVSVDALLSEYYTFKMSPSKGITEYVAHIDSLVNKLKQVNKPLTDEEVMAKVISGLTPEFASFTRIWEMTPALYKTKHMLVENLKKEHRTLETSGVRQEALYARNNGDQRKDNRRKKGNCNWCNKPGHFWRDCPTRPEGQLPEKRPQKKQGGKQTNNSNSSNKYCKEGERAFCADSGETETAGQTWYLDSGASSHMTGNRDWLEDYQPFADKRPIKFGNNEYLYAVGEGSVPVVSIVSKKVHKIRICNVHYVPNISDNLFSLSAVDEKGISVTFHDGRVNLSDGKEVVATGSKAGKLYKLDVKVPLTANIARRSRTIEEWHEVLGHADVRNIERMAKSGCVDGMEIAKQPPVSLHCGDCQRGKGQAAPHPSSSRERATGPLERVHIDLVGPVNPASLGGSSYFMLIKDEYSSYMFVKFLSSKGDVLVNLKRFVEEASLMSQKKVRCIRTDNGSEFNNQGIRFYCDMEDIVQEFSAPYTQQQNGEAERTNRTIIETARSNLQAAKLPLSLWSEAVYSSVYVRNRIPTKRHPETTPYERLIGRKPDISHLMRFGTPVHVLSHERGISKFGSRTNEAFVIGYGDRINTYRCWKRGSTTITISSDVRQASHSKQAPNFEQTNERLVVVGFPTASSSVSSHDNGDSQNADTERQQSREGSSEDFHGANNHVAAEEIQALEHAESATNKACARTDTQNNMEDVEDEETANNDDSLVQQSQDLDGRNNTFTIPSSSGEVNQNFPAIDPRRKTSEQPAITNSTQQQTHIFRTPEGDCIIPLGGRSVRTLLDDMASAAPSSSYFFVDWRTPRSSCDRTESNTSVVGTNPQGRTISANRNVQESGVSTRSQTQRGQVVLRPSNQRVTSTPSEARDPPSLVSRIRHNVNTFARGSFRNSARGSGRGYSAVVVELEPTSYTQAVTGDKADKWRQATLAELDAHRANETWSIVPRPPGVKEITAKWVFKIKRHPDESIDKYKARLVARGFSQVEGIDFKEIFAPVVRMDSVRLLFSIAAQLDLEFVQFDIATAFLYGTIDEELYMRPPEGFDIPSGHTCKLNKSLYGLRQAPRAWNKAFTKMIEEFELKPTLSDPCVFVGKDDLYLAIYVDDGIIFGRARKQIEALLAYLMKHLQVKIVDDSCFIGVQVERDRMNKSIYLHQSAYIRRMLIKYDMQDCKGAKSPMEAGHGLCSPDILDQPANNEVPYAAAIGSLLYCALATRPDIAHPLSVLSKFTSAPRDAHWKAVKRVFRYLQETHNYGLHFKRTGKPFSIKCFTDADWAGDQESRRSTSGMVTFVGSGPVSYRSQQQPCVALSTTEAEYIAASDAVKDLIWLKRFLKELRIEHDEKARLLCDNQSALKLIKNPEFHRRSKHIDIRYHFIRDKFIEGTFIPEYVSTDDQKADIFTKALTIEKFRKLRSDIGCTPLIDGES